MKRYHLYIICLSLLVFSSCEKTIELELPDYTPKIVLEGAIEQGFPAYVFVTRNVAYFGVTDSTALVNTIVTDAIVTISDGTNSEQLTLLPNPSYFPPLMYVGKTIIGEVGKTYTLTVKVDTNKITATTTIPAPIKYDNIWFKTEPDKDTLGYIWASFSDNPVIGNYYRIFTYRVGKDRNFVPLLGSVYDDKTFNGKTITFSMTRGFETFSDEQSRNDKNAQKEIGFYKVGETIIVKTCTMDEKHYDFWATQEQALFSGDNPFTSPIRIKSNVIGGLGVFGGYGATYDTIYATKP